MALSSKLRVMISSRCDDDFPTGKGATKLSDIRKELKKDLEDSQFLGKHMIEVWINEDTPPQPGTKDSWEVCLKAAKDCDILISLSNGNSGWANTGSDIGICHAELMTALSEAPEKVRLIDLGNIKTDNTPSGQRNESFQKYVGTQSLFRGGKVTSKQTLKDRVNEAIQDAILRLAQSGVRVASTGAYYKGQALDWSRLDFKKRRMEIVAVLKTVMMGRKGTKVEGDYHIVEIAGKDILIIPDAIPAALTVGPAKEMVGQPFLGDYKLAEVLKEKRGGPIHIIGCNKTATEAQALKLLGFPDATVVNAPFGIFVADQVQKIQFVFIKNCRDESTTRHGVQRFFEWITQTREDTALAETAEARARIVKAIAKENS